MKHRALSVAPRDAITWRSVGRWLLMLGTLGAATLAMYLVRGSLDKAHVALVYLLVVLAASAAGGRALGLAVAGLAFLCFDFFFLVPYLTLTIQNPLDWLVLVTFLITSVVAAQLLYRANATADEATQRAVEVDRLAALGAETLNAADADEALGAIASVIRTSADADECEICLHQIDGRVVQVACARRDDDQARDQAADAWPALTTPDARHRDVGPGSIVEWILDHASSAVELTDGTVRVAHELQRTREPGGSQRRGLQQETAAAVAAVVQEERRPAFGRLGRMINGDDGAHAGSQRTAVRALALPLRVREQTVGVLRLAARDELLLSPEQARMLIALSYYAALGAERARLVATAERAQAERRVESLRSALLTAVSHDLRTPLTTIKGLASEIRTRDGVERAAAIEKEVDRMDALVGDLLDLSRIHAGAVRPAIALNTIDDLMGAVLRATAGVLAGRRVDVDLSGDTLLAGYFDFSQMLRVLANLLDNAAKYSPSGSPIDVRAARDGERLVIDVMDRGPGISTAEREKIFAPFYRPPGVPADIRGHGLGLSIAKGLAEAQGSRVRYAPRDGGGSVFSLDLPAADTNALESLPELPALALIGHG